MQTKNKIGWLKATMLGVAVLGLGASSAFAVDDALTTAITAAMTVAKTNVTSVLVAGVALLALGMLWRFIKSGSKKVSLAITGAVFILGSNAFAVDDPLTTAITAAMTVAKDNVTTILVAGVALLALGMLWRFIKSGSKKVSL